MLKWHNHRFIAGVVARDLSLADRCRRLEGDAKVNWLSVCDATLNAARIVGCRAQAFAAVSTGLGHKRVIVQVSRYARSLKARSDFKPLSVGTLLNFQIECRD